MVSPRVLSTTLLSITYQIPWELLNAQLIAFQYWIWRNILKFQYWYPIVMLQRTTPWLVSDSCHLGGNLIVRIKANFYPRDV